MAVSPTRLWSGSLLFIVLLAGTGLAFWPFVGQTERMRTFCTSLPRGASIADVRARAEANDYEMSTPENGRALLSHSRALTRVLCVVQFDASGALAGALPAGD